MEALCKELYESQDAGVRSEAEKALVAFQNSPDSLGMIERGERWDGLIILLLFSAGKCQRLLERANSPYSQLLATTTITKLISRSSQSLELGSRVDIRNYVLNYLWTQPKLAQFVVQGMVTLFSRITKLGWFDSDKDEFVFRAVISDVTKFLQGLKYFLIKSFSNVLIGSAEHCMMGVQLLSQLVCEMNQISEADASRSLTKHRKIASSFRDTQLFEIFQLSSTLLRTGQSKYF